jgi:hypothetical protein
MVEDVLCCNRLDGATDALRSIAAAAFAGGTQTVAIRPAVAGFTGPAQVIWGRYDRFIPTAWRRPATCPNGEGERSAPADPELPVRLSGYRPIGSEAPQNGMQQRYFLPQISANARRCTQM